MITLLLGASQALATTYAPSPKTLERQISGATLVGEYVVIAATTVILDDGFPVTHVSLHETTAVRGDEVEPILILPGGVIEGEFHRMTADGFQMKEGETFFLMMEPAVDLPGYYNVAYGFNVAVFRKVEALRGPLMADSSGRIIADLRCDARPVYAIREATPTRDVDHDEDGREIAKSTFSNILVVDDPESMGVLWDEAIDRLVACGGDR